MRLSLLDGLNEHGLYRSEYLTLRDILKKDKPVLRCEAPDDSAAAVKGRPAVKCLDADSGLCVNCGDNHICRLPSFGNNVIYCEEYV
ncbi:hypothetical protein [Desulfococcus sp.]|uniref:hypothetical protein n=1 Tax=Desulfococcus sp. TaxID=2025834 RepID=UPI003593235F